jgi:hypothetical protein
VHYHCRASGRRYQNHTKADAASLANNSVHLQRVLLRIEQEVQSAKRSTDSAGRETDIATDHGEFTHLPPTKTTQVVQIMKEEGLHATFSSIHINGWIGTHSTLQGMHWMVQQLYSRDLVHKMQR